MRSSAQLLEDYMTPAELAIELDLALQTLAHWRSQKKGPPYVKVGQQILYSRDGVRRWLARQTKQA